jgi:hypothetical protein
MSIFEIILIGHLHVVQLHVKLSQILLHFCVILKHTLESIQNLGRCGIWHLWLESMIIVKNLKDHQLLKFVCAVISVLYSSLLSLLDFLLLFLDHFLDLFQLLFLGHICNGAVIVLYFLLLKLF